MSRLHLALLCAAGAVMATPQPPHTVPAAQPETTAVTATPHPARTHHAPARASRSMMRTIPPVWSRLAWCESRWHLHSTSPSGKHHGLFQIHEGWFKSARVDWRTATLQQQYRVALYVYGHQGARAWTCARKAGLR